MNWIEPVKQLGYQTDTLKMKCPNLKFILYPFFFTFAIGLTGCTGNLSAPSLGTDSCTHTSGQAPCNFGIDGVFGTDLGLPNQWGVAMATQADGKLVVIGVLIDYNDFTDMGRVGVARFLTDGTLDTTFGTAGKYITPVDNVNNWLDGNWIGGVAIQSDGKIVFSVGNQALTIMRLTSSGALDATFGTGGVYQDSNIGRANRVILQPDGKILVATTNITMTNGQMGVARLNTNGTLDGTFGTAGVAGVESSMMPGENMAADYIALQSDGKILFSTKLISAGGGIHLGFEISRLDTAGALDNTFGTSGQATINFGASYATSWGISVQSDGKIVMTGHTPGATQIAVARFLTDGTLDASFGTAGVYAVASPETSGAMAIESDSKILFAAGSSLYRLTDSGVLDSTWGTNGALAVPSVVDPTAMIVDASRVTLLGTDTNYATVAGAAVLVP